MQVKIDKSKKLYAPKKVLLIEPTHFSQNAEAMTDNIYMQKSAPPKDLNEIVIKEHKEFQKKVAELGGEPVVFKQWKAEAVDSIFACDWFMTLRDSAFPEGLLVIFPMRWHTRQLEKNPAVIGELRKSYKEFVDLSHWEKQQKALESIGCLSLDYHNRVFYYNESERAHTEVVHELVDSLNKLKKDQRPFTSHLIKAWDPQNKAPVFHTSMYLNFTDSTVFYGPDFVVDQKERELLSKRFHDSGYDIIELTPFECNEFCSNVLEFKGKDDALCLTISSKASKAYSKANLAALEKKYKISVVHNDTTLEFGGGSIRCMSNPLL